MQKQIAGYLEAHTLGKEGGQTKIETAFLKGPDAAGVSYPLFINQFWTARQRQALSIHEVSYRACFKPQLPRFFINLLTKKGQVLYDPFCGRGTTLIEGALLKRKIVGNDINPLSSVLCLPRLNPPELSALQKRLTAINLNKAETNKEAEIDLSMFYHPQTMKELVALKNYFKHRQEEGTEDHLDRWIKMVATNRLTGHSKGFFSVYTLPPNQAVTQNRQLIINERLQQKPEYRDVAALIMKKSRQLLRGLTAQHIKALKKGAAEVLFFTEDAAKTPGIASESIDLSVTSPPFLNIVQYADDNWLRFWFNGIERGEVENKMTMTGKVSQWEEVMSLVFKELFRITRPGGWVAFEVGEIKKGKIKLEDLVIPLALLRGFTCFGVVINRQHFTKTSNIWGVKNNLRGTNSNRVVLLNKPA